MAKVNTKHPEYLAMEATWAMCRDFTKGSQAVKDQGEAYLPKLSGQDEESYRAYKSRAQFYNASGRTVDGMGGLVMRVDPTVELPAKLADLETDVDYQGTSLFEFSKRLVTEDLEVGRMGILVDMPTRGIDVSTMAQAQAAGLRPYLAFYATESILNWRTQRLNGAMVLTMVVLLESVQAATDDEFEMTTQARIRVLDLDEGGHYRQRLFAPKGNDKNSSEWEQEGEDIYPLKGNEKTNQIPFVFIGAETNTTDVQKPPIADLVEVNLGHYRNSADHEHGLHFTALPTPVISGHTPQEGEAIGIGAETFLCLPKAESKAYFMEFTGKGLEPVQKAMEKKERQMATLGARMLADDSKGVEAAETARIHRSGEGGVLGSLSSSVSKGIRRALVMARDWIAATGEVTFELNKDFLPTSMPPAMLQQLLNAWQSGAISQAVFFDNLKRGELIGSEVTLEQMQEDINNTIPGAAGPPGDETGA